MIIPKDSFTMFGGFNDWGNQEIHNTFPPDSIDPIMQYPFRGVFSIGSFSRSNDIPWN
jgi:hypothetical protein